MRESENQLYAFLMEQGIPKKSLPKLIEISKDNLVPIMEGHTNTHKSKNFYICVCTSGHGVCCGEWEWVHSGWNIRVKGKEIIFSKGKWEIDLTTMPIFQNVLFIVSTRTNVSESAQSRSDILCVSKNRKRLYKRKKITETNRNQQKKKK